MHARAQLSVTDLRRAARHSVDCPVSAEHRVLGSVNLHIVNLSAHGFMVCGEVSIGRGERLTVRLPELGRIEAFLVWKTEDRAGFQFERIIRYDHFMRMIEAVSSTPRLRRRA